MDRINLNTKCPDIEFLFGNLYFVIMIGSASSNCFTTIHAGLRLTRTQGLLVEGGTSQSSALILVR